MNKSKSLYGIIGILLLALLIFSGWVLMGQRTAEQLKIQAMNTANSAATSVQSTAQAQIMQTLQAVAAQATQAMATANAQATAKIEGTKQIDLNLFPNNEIKIAVHVPLSGSLGESGLDVLQGAQLALAQRGQSLIGMGYNISIAPYDDQANPDVGVENARQIVRDSSILCVVGHINSGVAIFTSDEYHAAGLAMVSPGATREILTDRGYPEINRVIGRGDRQGLAAAQYLRDIGISAAFVVYDNPSYGQPIATEFEKGAKAFGITLLGLQPAETDEQLAALVEQIVPLNPEVVYYAGIYDKAAPFFSQLRAKGYQGLLMGPDGLDYPDLLQQGGPTLKSGRGLIYSTIGDPYNATVNFPSIKSFYDNFQAYFGQPPKTVFWAMQGYDAMSVCLQGIETVIRQKGNVLTRDDIAAAIRSQEVQGFRRTLAFDEKGDLTHAEYLFFQVTAPFAQAWNDNAFLSAVEVAPLP